MFPHVLDVSYYDVYEGFVTMWYNKYAKIEELFFSAYSVDELHVVNSYEIPRSANYI